MTFVEWLAENYDYRGDGSLEELTAEYSASELDTLYNIYYEQEE